MHVIAVASSAGSNSLGPALLGLIGTVIGAILAGSISMWNLRGARKRDVELEAIRYKQDESVRRRIERREIYVEWLGGFGRLMDAVTIGHGSELRHAINGLLRVADMIEIVASGEVTTAVRAEIAAIRRFEARVTDREEILAQAIELHEKALVLMRSDVQ